MKKISEHYELRIGNTAVRAEKTTKPLLRDYAKFSTRMPDTRVIKVTTYQKEEIIAPAKAKQAA